MVLGFAPQALFDALGYARPDLIDYVQRPLSYFRMNSRAGDVLSDAGHPCPHPKEYIVHSHHNGLKTAALLGLLTAMILAVGYWLGGSGGLVFAVSSRWR